MSSDVVVEVSQVGKAYPLYARPIDRLWQMFSSFWCRKLGLRQATRYREFHALQDVSVRIAQGGNVGIIGRNGSGKSTLLQLLCGTLQPQPGPHPSNRAGWPRCRSWARASTPSFPGVRTSF